MSLTGSTHWAETCEHEKSSIRGTFQKFLILCLNLCLSTGFCHLSAFWVVRGSQNGRKWTSNPSKSIYKFSRGQISCNLIDLSTCCCDMCPWWVQNRAIWVIWEVIWEFSSLVFNVGWGRMVRFGHLTPLNPSTNWAESHSDADSSIRSDSYATFDDDECFGAHFGAKIRFSLMWCDFT